MRKIRDFVRGDAMTQVALTIAGRVYRIACDEGEEDHLGELAHLVDGKIEGLRERFGEIGDQRLTIMAAITLADDLGELNRRIHQLEAELSTLKVLNVRNVRDEWGDRVAVSIDEAALRIERVAQDLNGCGRE
jgi:cell division protein ZapA